MAKINDGQQNYCRKSCLRFRPLTEASWTAGPVQNRGMQILTRCTLRLLAYARWRAASVFTVLNSNLFGVA